MSAATACRLTALAGLLAALVIASGASTTASSLYEVGKLTGDQFGSFNDQFGQAVAISGDTALVGSPDENFGSPTSGAVYVFERDVGGAGNWGDGTKLTSQQTGHFGTSVAIDGDTAVMVSGSAAHVHDRDHGGANSWGHVTSLAGSGTHSSSFRVNAAVSGDTAVVAGFFSDFIALRTPVVYVFERNEGGKNNWGEAAYLIGSGVEPFDDFGESAAIDGDTIVVGAPEGGGTKPPTSLGTAYIFERNRGGEGNWGEVGKITGSESVPGDDYATSVDISGDTVIVGAYRSNSHPRSCCTGAAYIFQRDVGGPDSWGEVKKITSADGQTGWFGISVAVSGDTAVAGARNAGDSGLAYAFQRDWGGQDSWGQTNVLAASNGARQDFFGLSVGVSGDTAVVGAPGELGAPIKGCCGSAYVFDLLLQKPTPTGDVNCDGLVDARDAVLVLQLRAGILGALPCEDVADVDEDGTVTSVDAVLILQFAAGLVVSLPP